MDKSRGTVEGARILNCRGGCARNIPPWNLFATFAGSARRQPRIQSTAQRAANLPGHQLQKRDLPRAAVQTHARAVIIRRADLEKMLLNVKETFIGVLKKVAPNLLNHVWMQEWAG
jgi:hypothetical protein